RGLVFLLFCFAAVQVFSAEEPKTQIGSNSLESLTGVSPRVTLDSTVKAEGESSLKIEADGPCRVTVARFSGTEFDKFVLVTNAHIKTSMKNGTVILETLVRVKDGYFFSRAMDMPIGGETDWQTVKTSFFFQENERPEEILVNLVVEGVGSIWVDNVVLNRE
ncbi:MAG: hypothetical protein ACOYXC_00445, partial [Candidatus Rifleibacteriota bacterium]